MKAYLAVICLVLGASACAATGSDPLSLLWLLLLPVGGYLLTDRKYEKKMRAYAKSIGKPVMINGHMYYPPGYVREVISSSASASP
jgi:uncharacterized membrane protein